MLRHTLPRGLGAGELVTLELLTYSPKMVVKNRHYGGAETLRFCKAALDDISKRLCRILPNRSLHHSEAHELA